MILTLLESEYHDFVKNVRENFDKTGYFLLMKDKVELNEDSFQKMLDVVDDNIGVVYSDSKNEYRETYKPGYTNFGNFTFINKKAIEGLNLESFSSFEEMFNSILSKYIAFHIPETLEKCQN